MASDVGMARVVFSPSGASALSLFSALWTDLPKNDDPNNMFFQVPFPRIPNFPVFPWYQIAKLYRECKEGDPNWEFLRSNMLANEVRWGVVFNTSAELERVYIDQMKREVGHDRVWAVGPVLPPDDDVAGTTERGGSSSVTSHKVLTWLNSRKDNSVVYVCFGSRHVLTAKQTQAPAYRCVLDALRLEFGAGRHIGRGGDADVADGRGPVH